MKTKPAIAIGAFVGATLLAGCGPYNTVQFHRDNTPYGAFLADREQCVAQATQCIAQRYANSSYNGEKVEQLYPSRLVYLSCMDSRGYLPVTDGFVPPVLVLMTDYPPGRDCIAH